MSPRNNLSGWIILDKPAGVSSAYAVGKVKHLLRPEKIGHAGTLDPMASGILPLALGEATKTVQFMMDTRKAYSFTVVWGQERDTDDAAGQVVRSSEMRPGRAQVEAVLAQFQGVIQQVPPDYSAIKVDGQRAYKAARGGEALQLKARDVQVYMLKMNAFSETEATFTCECGKGTYIRSIARDIGREIGCLAYVSMLRRLGVSGFGEKDAISLEVMAGMVHKDDLSFLRPVEAALDDIPACDVSPDQALRLRQGQKVFLPHVTADMVLVRCNGKPLAVCSVMQGSLKPARVFNL